MKRKVVFVFTAITLPGFHSLGRRDIAASFLPHGFAMLATICRDAGHDVEWLDMRGCTSWLDLERRVDASAGEVFCFGPMSVDFQSACKAAGIVKRIFPRAANVIGGVHATIVPDEAVKAGVFDVVCRGEAENVIAHIAASAQPSPQGPRVIDGTQPNLDALPIIDRDLCGGRYEHETPFLEFMKPPAATILTGRGCPYQCSFCQPAERLVFGGKVRQRSVENVIAEITHLHKKYAIRSLMVHDDLFFVSAKWVGQFLEAYERNGLAGKLQLIAQCRADIICESPALIRDMAKAGLAGLLIGFESGNQEILDKMRKGTTVEQNLAAGRICRDLGIKVFANFMFGVPGETRSQMLDTVRMMRQIQPLHYSAAVFTPFPGVDLTRECEEKGIIVRGSERMYDRDAHAGPKLLGVDYHFIERAVVAATLNSSLSTLEWESARQTPIRVLVTGAAGYVGRQVLRVGLSKGNLDLSCIVRPDQAARVPLEARCLTVADLSSAEAAARIRAEKPEVVMHLAAELDGARGAETLMRENVELTAALYNAASEAGARQFVFASSTEAVGPLAASELMANEDVAPRPTSPYGRSKLLAEERLRAMAGPNKPRAAVIRLGPLYGRSPQFIMPLLDLVLHRGSMVRYASILDHVALQLLHVDDAAAALLGVIGLNEEFVVLNATSGERTTVRGWCERIADLTGTTYPHVRVRRPQRMLLRAMNAARNRDLERQGQTDLLHFLTAGGRARAHRAYGTGRILEKLNFRPQVMWPAGLRETLAVCGIVAGKERAL